MHVMTPEVLVFSKKVWDTLTPGRAGRDPQGRQGLGALLRQAVGSQGEGRRARRCIKGGAKIIPAAEIDRKSFVDVEKPVWDKFATTPELEGAGAGNRQHEVSRRLARTLAMDWLDLLNARLSRWRAVRSPALCLAGAAASS